MSRRITEPSLDGYRLVGIGATDFEVTPSLVGQVLELSSGSRREQLSYWGEGLPDRRIRHEFRIAWAHLRQLGRPIRFLLSRPGPHTWTDWRAVEVSYAGNGARREWLLPWPLADQELGTPAGVPEEDLAPFASLSVDDLEGLTVEVLDAATYDGGDPGAGELWIDHEGRRLKLEDPLPSGEVLYLSIVPLFRGVELSAEPRRPGFVRDPLSLRLGEVAW